MRADFPPPHRRSFVVLIVVARENSAAAVRKPTRLTGLLAGFILARGVRFRLTGPWRRTGSGAGQLQFGGDHVVPRPSSRPPRNAWLMPQTSSGASTASGWNGQLSNSISVTAGWGLRSRARREGLGDGQGPARRQPPGPQPVALCRAELAAAPRGTPQAACRAGFPSASVSTAPSRIRASSSCRRSGMLIWMPGSPAGRAWAPGRPSLVPPIGPNLASSRPAATSLSRWCAASLRRCPRWRRPPRAHRPVRTLHIAEQALPLFVAERGDRRDRCLLSRGSGLVPAIPSPYRLSAWVQQ
jgi:hypothetical protein